jgi:starch phosphorylase
VNVKIATKPSALHTQLVERARNYRWVWDGASSALLDAVLAAAGAPAGVHPFPAVTSLDDATLAFLAADPTVVAAAAAISADLAAAVAARPEPRIAYFSPEFGVAGVLPQYSGGLGILAGDHLKAASDTEIPLVAVGLFYREGFFRQELVDGGQRERYEKCDAEALGLTDTGVTVEVPLGDVDAVARVWRADIGITRLYVLDTDVEENTPSVRVITDRLYSGDQEHRLRQELVLGIGGTRALAALGIEPLVYHLNEGHAGFLLLELLAGELASGHALLRSINRVRARTVFTTHTPVPAGIDRFPVSLVERYLGPWAKTNGMDFADVVELGILPSDGDEPPFNMAAFGLNVCGRANGVSKLHGAVSRHMFDDLQIGARITSVTNGVHARTWVHPRWQRAFDHHLGGGWSDGDVTAWEQVGAISDVTIRTGRAAGRAELAALVSERSAPLASGSIAPPLDPDALVIGFARRFATYKRAALLLGEPDRLAALLANAEQPVQFVFAGKAHPADNEGKAVLAQIAAYAAEHGNGRFVFVPDYDIDVARILYAGTDVWLNNPLRPHEACGTSGMKAALNGSLNCSIPDGWWDEWYDGRNGWSIPGLDETHATRDAQEAKALYAILEREIVPEFYDRGVAMSPAWIERVRDNWLSLGPLVTASRMVREYDNRLYQR